ncbi:TetR/AcrR family transcriptional regulator [Aquipuribacter nitratireducens]|uniref:TetR/AcrR family transcriptional regulator n=1 Tax=Aquipuribacter nitratireducens TaxID=650104 RepID=A0ABW0GWD9_9MICO
MSTRGPYRTGRRRREQLIDVAVGVFAELGYAGGSIRDIADRAGVSHSTLIKHFGSKENLLVAVLAEWDRRTVQAGLADVDGLAYFRRLPAVMAAHRHNRGLLELFTTIAAEASAPTHPAHAFIAQRYTRNLATLAGHLRSAVDAGDVAPMTDADIQTEVRLLTATLDGIGLQWLLDPSTDLEACVSAYVHRAIAAWQRA